MVQQPAFWLALLVGVPLYWALPARLRAGFLAAVSAGVLARVAPGVVLAVGAGATATWALLRGARARRSAFVAVLVVLVGQLAVFKYLPPLLPGLLGQVLVPLGLSFTTFKLLHYAIEARRGNLAPHGLADVLAWILLFPAFTAGPIERFDHFQAETRPAWSGRETVEGLWRIAGGLVKRFVLAELVLGELYKSMDAAEFVAQLDGLPAWQVWGWLARSFVRLYLDFGGYTDIAVGASLLFGRRIAENFDLPLLARSPADFWQRWHMSLARWCSAYVYMPALGLTRRPSLAVYATFLVMGLWHAGSPHWVVWGLWQGTGVALTMAVARRLRRRKGRARAWAGTLPVRALGAALTFAWMCLAQAFTALHGVAPLSTSLHVLARLFGGA